MTIYWGLNGPALDNIEWSHTYHLWQNWWQVDEELEGPGPLLLKWYRQGGQLSIMLQSRHFLTWIPEALALNQKSHITLQYGNKLKQSTNIVAQETIWITYPADPGGVVVLVAPGPICIGCPPLCPC